MSTNTLTILITTLACTTNCGNNTQNCEKPENYGLNLKYNLSAVNTIEIFISIVSIIIIINIIIIIIIITQLVMLYHRQPSMA